MRITTAVFLALIVTVSAGAQESWPFEPGPDTFREDALLDLRWMNEPETGGTGFVRLSPDGDDFVRGDGKPLRFWAVGGDVYRKAPEGMDRHCPFLAKLGVNRVRLHATVAVRQEGSAVTDVNEKESGG